MIKSVIWQEIKSWSIMIVITVLIAVLITQFVIVNASIPTGSMQPLIMPRDRVIASRLSYISSSPQRYDVIIFRPPHDSDSLYIKRVIGLPGEMVSIRSGLVYINDSIIPLEDNFVQEHVYGDFGPFYVPSESYFVLGDNRGNSTDSRLWENPFVPSENILGRAIFKYYRGFELLTWRG